MTRFKFSTRRPLFAVFALVVFFLLPSGEKSARACTTALFRSEATHDGAPLLWKNRDTDVLSNKVIFVAGRPLGYLGLVNAENTSGDQIWAGVNAAGLAIFNSASYNLTDPSSEAKDREGFIMADILRSCRAIADVETYFASHMGKHLGSEANFAVMDATGRVVLLEVDNHFLKKFDVADQSGKYLVNTNFSRSGAAGKGAGYLRFDRASALLAAVTPGDVSPMFIFNHLARDFGHQLIFSPTPKQLEERSGKEPWWISTVDTIDRADTASAVVIQGRREGDPSSRATFWVTLGEPLASIAVPLWVEAKTTPALLREGKDAPLYLASLRVRKLFRPFTESDKENYIDLARLINHEATGTLAPLLEAQNKIFAATADFLRTNPTDDQLAPFAEKMAELAFSALNNI